MTYLQSCDNKYKTDKRNLKQAGHLEALENLHAKWQKKKWMTLTILRFWQMWWLKQHLTAHKKPMQDRFWTWQTLQNFTTLTTKQHKIYSEDGLYVRVTWRWRSNNPPLRAPLNNYSPGQNAGCLHYGKAACNDCSPRTSTCAADRLQKSGTSLGKVTLTNSPSAQVRHTERLTREGLTTWPSAFYCYWFLSRKYAWQRFIVWEDGTESEIVHWPFTYRLCIGL